MLFNSWAFLIFFPVTTIIYYLLPQKLQTVFLLLASCFFYMAYKPIYILVIIYLILVDYTAGILIEKTKSNKKKWLLIASLFVNVGTLIFFKYSLFLGLPTPWNFLLPLGLSFHTFQSMSYTIEVYKGTVRAERNLLIYALYVFFYPQLVAGPIERPQHFIPQLKRKHTFSQDNLVYGLRLMLLGFFKKIVIADNIAVLIEPIFRNPHIYSSLSLLVASYLFAFQIYADFSGYTDIGRGAARVLGYDLVKNFNSPYLSTSISEFWRRWHISLSSWFRDYIYIPLGGSRGDKIRTFFNILIVFLISGLWHGADWKFVMWGGVLGLLLIIGVLISRLSLRLPWIIRWFFTFQAICLSWILFRANSLSDAWYMYKKIFYGVIHLNLHGISFINTQLFIVIGSIVFMEGIQLIEGKASIDKLFSTKPLLIRWALCYLLIFATIFLGNYNEMKFIYFQF